MPARVAILLIAATAWLYFTGWMYLYYYLESFGFSIFEADIPYHYFFVYAFAVVDAPITQMHEILLALFICGLLYLALRHVVADGIGMSRALAGHRVRQFLLPDALDTRIVVSTVTVLGAVLMFFYAHQAARASAGSEAERVRLSANPRLLLVDEITTDELLRFKEKAYSVEIWEFLVQNGQQRAYEDYRVSVVFADKSRYYLFLKHEKADFGASVSLEKWRFVFVGERQKTRGDIE
jgi:hypothetical protein